MRSLSFATITAGPKLAKVPVSIPLVVFDVDVHDVVVTGPRGVEVLLQ
jgi:hypothetical protein